MSDCDDDLLNYLKVIVPERASGFLSAADQNSVSNESKHPSSVALDHIPISARLLAKHPSGDRHPKPDHQTRYLCLQFFKISILLFLTLICFELINWCLVRDLLHASTYL